MESPLSNFVRHDSKSFEMGLTWGFVRFPPLSSNDGEYFA